MKFVFSFLLFGMVFFAAEVPKHAIETKKGAYILSNTLIVKFKNTAKSANEQINLSPTLFSKLAGAGKLTTR